MHESRHITPERSGLGLSSFKIYWSGPISELNNIHCVGVTGQYTTLASVSCATIALNF